MRPRRPPELLCGLGRFSVPGGCPDTPVALHVRPRQNSSRLLRLHMPHDFVDAVEDARDMARYGCPAFGECRRLDDGSFTSMDTCRSPWTAGEPLSGRRRSARRQDGSTLRRWPSPSSRRRRASLRSSSCRHCRGATRRSAARYRRPPAELADPASSIESQLRNPAVPGLSDLSHIAG